MNEHGRMRLEPGFYNSFETVIEALEIGGKQAQSAGFIAHGACLLHAATELKHVWEDRQHDTPAPQPQPQQLPYQPAERGDRRAEVEPLLRTRFKLSFNKAGNCTVFRKDQAEELDGQWVWLIDASDGGNSPLYSQATIDTLTADRDRLKARVEANVRGEDSRERNYVLHGLREEDFP